MKNIGFGVIGLGRQGLRLAEHIREDVPCCKLVAACRRSEIGSDYSKKHDIKFYRDYRDLLNDSDVDAVIIATPSSLHGVQALDALRAKKHVLIDKPIASTIEEGRRIVTLAKRNNLTAAVNFPLRVNPVTSMIKNNLKTIGKLKKVQIMVSHGQPRSEWQNDLKLSNGGVILDLGSHYFDLITFLSGCMPKMINSVYTDKSENEHSGFIELSYNGFSASVVLMRNQKLKKTIVTCAGDKGFVYADYALREVSVSNNHSINEIKCPASNDFEIILSNMSRAIRKREKIIANAEAGVNSLQIALSAYEAKTAAPVTL
jgi:UDP-N-acetyl-2-amino-2-deoxyglucuronate dehydrogenase